MKQPHTPEATRPAASAPEQTGRSLDQLSSRVRFTLGVILMVLSGLGFAVQGLFVNLAGDLPPVQKTFSRYVIVFIVSLFFLLRQRSKKRAQGIPLDKLIPTKADLGWLLLRSTLGTIGVLANFYALDHIPIGNAQLLNKLSPFFTIIFSAIFLRERVNRVQIAGIALAFVGVFVLLDPDASGISLEYAFPMAIAILGGVAAGAAYTTIRHLGARGVDGSFIVCFFAGFGVVSLLIPTLANFQPMTAEQTLYVLLFGLAAVVGQYGITYAYHFAEPRRISIFDYSAVVFSMLLGTIFLDQIPTRGAIIGATIIFIAFLIMFLYNRRTAVDPADA